MNQVEKSENTFSLMKYSLIGIIFGIQSFHMYGVIGTAVTVGIISVAILKKFSIKTLGGENIVIQKKKFSKGQIFGGLLFGLGWAMTGACPGPLFAQIGAGMVSIIVVIASALAGTWTYGLLKEKLPH